MNWRPVKRPSGTCYDVATENGIRMTAWPIAKLCHAKVLAALVLGTSDEQDGVSEHSKLAVLRCIAITRAFYRWEANDRSRNFPEAVASWNAYVPTVRVWTSPDGRVDACSAGERMAGWTELPNIVPSIMTD